MHFLFYENGAKATFFFGATSDTQMPSIELYIVMYTLTIQPSAQATAMSSMQSVYLCFVVGLDSGDDGPVEVTIQWIVCRDNLPLLIVTDLQQ